MSLHYVAFQSLHEAPLMIPARLQIPDGNGPYAAVLILHGSAGPSGREGGYADVLLGAGIATLEPDQWSPRALSGGSQGRPRTVIETLPDVYGARRFLAAHPRIDPQRIGVMGFSFGGIASMLAATHAHNDRFAPNGHFAAHMPCYPVCWLYGAREDHRFENLVDAPVFILTAALDQYDDDEHAGDKLVEELRASDRSKVTTRAMAGCHHGFDMPGIDIAAEDPFCHRGKGGTMIMRHNPEATQEAHALALAFFLGALGAKSGGT